MIDVLYLQLKDFASHAFANGELDALLVHVSLDFMLEY